VWFERQLRDALHPNVFFRDWQDRCCRYNCCLSGCSFQATTWKSQKTFNLFKSVNNKPVTAHNINVKKSCATDSSKNLWNGNRVEALQWFLFYYLATCFWTKRKKITTYCFLLLMLPNWRGLTFTHTLSLFHSHKHTLT